MATFDLNTFEADTTTETSTYTKPLIRPGQYAGRIIRIKPFQDKNGKWINAEQGHQLIFDLEVYKIQADEDDVKDPGTVTKALTTKTDNIERDVTLSQFVYITYAVKETDGKTIAKDPATGEPLQKTSLAPGNKPATILQAFGWKGPEKDKKLKVAELLGNWASLTVDDFQKKDGVGNNVGEKFSVIKSVSPLRAIVPPALNTPLTTPSPPEDTEMKAVVEDVQDNPRITELKAQLKEGLITQRGYDLALEQLQRLNQ